MKKTIYIILATFLGIIISFLFHAGIEYWYLSSTDAAIISWSNNGSCALPIWLQVLLLVAGIVGGIVMGFWWWKIVYVQKRHWRMKNK